MSAPNTLSVRTLAGLTLRLRHHRNQAIPDGVSASLDLPLSRAERAAHRVFGQQVAFINAGSRLRDVRIASASDCWKDSSPSLWLGSTNIEVDEATIATVQAWLDSRTPWPDPDTATLPDNLPNDIPTRAVPELPA